MILYIGHSKDATKKLLELINESDQVESKNFPFDLFCFFGTYFFKIINSVVQLILLKKNSLASFHLRGEELGIFVHQLSTG